MDNYKVDVTGHDLLKSNSAIIVVYNNKYIYAYQLNEKIRCKILEFFRTKKYGFNNHKILKPKVYAAILSLIIKQILIEQNAYTDDYHFDLCNDLDGHSQDIIQYLKNNFTNLNLLNDFNCNKYLFVRHPKKSLVQQSGLNIKNGNWDEIIKIKFEENLLHNLIAKNNFKNNKW